LRLPSFAPNRPVLLVAAGCLIGSLGFLSGCILDVPSFIDPGEMAGLRNRPNEQKERLVVDILDDLDPGLEAGTREFATAENPTAADTVSEPTDYVVGADDLRQVTIYDVEVVCLQTIKQARVSGTGNVTLPYLPNVVRAEGLTELELQQAIQDAYKQAGVLEQANVSVSVGEARNRAYTLLGSVTHPSEYLITKDNFRVLDALTQGGDITSPFIENIYVLRRTDLPTRTGGSNGARPTSGPTTRPSGKGSTQPVDDLAPPSSRGNKVPTAMKRAVMLQDSPATAPGDPTAAGDPLAPESAATTGAAPTAPAEVGTEVKVTDDDPTARVGRIDGQEVVVQPSDDKAPSTAISKTGDMGGNKPFEFNELPEASNIRVIRIPISKIRSGDLRWNIVIHPRDTVFVPPGMIGFYYMNGHVSGTGAYAFQGQKVTLTNAIAAARGLDGLAIPQRTDIIRKIGPNQKMYYRVDLARIYAGKSPDIYLKPDDQVLVGTNFLAPFLAAIRGGFRMTYGFGFLYDRNYAYDTNNQNR
jgi:protein involved in polysaccharide export with SLBB domain